MSLTAPDAITYEESAFAPVDEDVYGGIVPFGIKHVDEAFMAGVKPYSPQIIAIQGGSGARKTTLILNIIKNMCLSNTLIDNHRIIFDTLENGMTVERVFLALRQMVATQILIYEYHLRECIPANSDPREYLWWLFNQPLPSLGSRDLCLMPTDTINGKETSICVLTADFVETFYREQIQMTERQLYAWQLAGQVIRDFPLEVFGTSEHPNFEEAERRSEDTTNIEASLKRWLKLAEEYGGIQVISDHLGEYWFGRYVLPQEKQGQIVPYYARFVKTARCTLWAINQEGIGHQKDFRQLGIVYGSMGGDVLKSTAQLNWRVGYNQFEDKYHMLLYTPVKGRRGSHPDLRLNIEPNSGCIFGDSQVAERE